MLKFKVIVVLNSKYIRTLQAADLNEPFYTINVNDDESLKYGKVVLPFKNFENEKLSVLGHINHNLLSFVMNVLLQYNFKSIVMFKYQKPTQNILDEINEIKPKKQDIFVYKPSKAERGYLEERI